MYTRRKSGEGKVSEAKSFLNHPKVFRSTQSPKNNTTLFKNSSLARASVYKIAEFLGFSFLSFVLVCQRSSQVCEASKVLLLFGTFFRLLDMVLLVSSIFCNLCSNLGLPLCFHSNFHITLYNLFVQSSLNNHNCVSFFSIYLFFTSWEVRIGKNSALGLGYSRF